jgi:hypothetical protein
MLSVGVCVLFFVCSALGQTSSGLSGIVHDSSGAVLPGVTVKLTNVEQAIVRNAISNEAGVYQFSFLPSGTYDVEASLPSFKTSLRKGVAVAAAQNLKLDFVLEVTSLAEDVTVTASTEAVNAESAQLGAVIDSHAVVETPLAGRIFWNLPVLTANVQPPVQGSGLGYRGGFNVAGSCEGCNNFVLNGMDNNDNVKTIPNFRPSIDAIQEFNVLTGIFPAEYGYATGGQIIMNTKSGTNGLHGSGYDFVRNSNFMTARNFFIPATQNPNLSKHNFGVTLGGPIKKNKTFFFISYEGLQQHNDVYDQQTIPTPAEIAGDFSSIPKTIIDPQTGKGFPNNKIPNDRISPIGAALLAFYPVPNVATPAGAIPNANYNYTAERDEEYNESSVKLDHTFSPKDSGYLTGNWYLNRSVEWANTLACNGGESLPTFNCDLSYRSEVYGLTETHVFSPTVVNEAKASWTISIQPAIARKANYDFWGPFGISPVVTTLPSLPHLGIPSSPIQGYYTISVQGHFKRTDPHWQLADSLSWTHNKHTTKFGVNVSHFTSNNANVGNNTGTLTFTNTSSGPTTGYALSDVLLGLPASTGAQPYVNKIYIRASNYSAYAQDDFRVTSSLTLNLGLRWEMNGAPYEKNGLIINFDRTLGVPVIQGSNPYFIYQPGNFTDSLNRDAKEFNPRFGLAWQPFKDGKTVVRFGAGRFLNNLSYYNGLSNIYAAYPVKYTYNSSLAAPLTLANPFPVNVASGTLSTAATGADRNFVNARAYEITLGIQHELRQGLVLDVSFLGKAERHLNQSHNINQPRPGAGTPAQVNARRPYPQWGSISFTQWDGNLNYDALSAKLTQQYRNGLSFNVSYTYSHTIDNVGGVTDQLNFRTARGDSQYDLRHRLVISPVWELPFGPGKPWAASGLAAKIAGGWQLSPLYQYQTGNHLTPSLSGNYSNSGGTTDRPDMISDPNQNAPHTQQQWFNTSAFILRPANGAVGATYSFGNAGKGVIVGPSNATLDVSLVRNIQASERFKIQLRAEMFNALNHTNFGFPNVQADNPSFGRISTALDPRQSQFAVKFLF